MTGSPVFKFSSHQTKKQKIQRKLSFVRDVPRNQRRLHIDNLLDSDKNSDSQDEKVIPKPAKSFSSLSSFVFENKKGVKRKLDFDADEVSDEVSSFRFSNQNISLNGFHSRNSSLGDVKSITISPSKHRGHRSSCTRSSITSTCRRRLFPDAEPELKKAKLESPILCPRPKKKEVKLSLQKRFPGVPNSDAARSGLLLNLAFSKYNMLNNDKAENVSVDFVGEKNAKSSSKKELLQYSSIKKDSSSFHFSPVFKAIKKVKRKLDLEDDNATKKPTDVASANETSISKLFSVGAAAATETSMKTDGMASDSAVCKEIEKQDNGARAIASSPIEAQKSVTHGKVDFVRNSRLRPSLKNEIFNLSKPGQEDSLIKVDGNRMQRRSNFSHPGHVLSHRSSLGCVKVKSKCDRIIVNKDLEEKSSLRTDGDTSSCSKNTESVASRSAKRWFDDSFYKGKRSDLRKSLFHRRQDAFLDSHIQRFLNDCAQAAELGVPNELPNNQGSESKKESSSQDEPASRIEDVESPVRVKVNQAFPSVEEISRSDAEAETAVHPKETSPIIQLDKRKASSKSSSKKMSYCENSVLSPEKQKVINSDFIIEDSTSQEINKHCIEEVEIFIENAESHDGFVGFTDEDCQLADDSFDEMKNFSVLDVTANSDTLHVAIEEESAYAGSQKSNLVDPDLLVCTFLRCTILFCLQIIIFIDFQVEEVSSSESISEELHFTEPTEESSTPSKYNLETNNDEIFDSAKKRKRKKCYS